MIRREGREASENKSGIKEDEKQSVMARQAARWRRSNLVILVTLKKGNQLSEAYVRRGRRKTLYRRVRNSLEKPQKEAKIQCKTLRRGKNLAFKENKCLEKESV